MARPKGMDHFRDFFQDFKDSYVIIGGSAAAILLEDEGLEFRATVDIDVVLLANSSKELNKKFAEYVRAGAYQTKEASEGTPRYYRFSKPGSEDFPEIIEIFAGNEAKLELREGQYIIPVQNDDVAKISAILLDDEYFEILKATSKQSSDGFSIINSIGMICMKARAFRELSARNDEVKKIKKHRNDIVRMVQILKKTDSYPLTGTPLLDLLMVREHIRTKLSDKEIKQIIGNASLNLEDVLSALERVFNL